MSAETSFAVMLCPINVWFMWEGIIKCEKKYIISSLALLVFMISVYQAVLPMCCAGILIIYFLHLEDQKLGKRTGEIFWKIVLSYITATIGYFVLNWIITHLLFHLEESSYLTGMIGGQNQSLSKSVFKILYSFYNLIFGGDNWFNRKFIEPIVASRSSSGINSAIYYREVGGELACVLYLPALLVAGKHFLLKEKQSCYYYVAGMGILICSVIFIIVGCGEAPIRSLYPFALVSGFLFYYILLHARGRAKNVWLLLIIIFGLFQAQKSAFLVASDQVRYEADLQMATSIHNEIIRVEQEEGTDNLPVLILGNYEFQYGGDYLCGEIPGRSCLMHGAGQTKLEATHRTIAFMKSQGMPHDEIDLSCKNLDTLRQAAKSMPSYPSKGWVKIYDNAVIVKLAELAYMDQQIEEG